MSYLFKDYKMALQHGNSTHFKFMELNKLAIFLKAICKINAITVKNTNTFLMESGEKS